MSTTIDEKVVEMRFDNKQFESGVQTSLSTLDKLKQSLNLEGAAKGLESLGDAAKKCTLSTLSNSVETVRTKFSALEVMAMTALSNITNSAVNAGKRIISQFTVEPITTGFNEYELKMGSIQTIMASTGESLDRVNQKLDELNTYSDKTIYSFSDMTSNIGKFTNAGVKLDDAVAAIQGVSNVAAVSGANANEASRAMYNFAQALSAGYVKLIDWKSIENANMATVEFKDQLLETALALGTVVKEGDKYRTTTTDAKGAVSDLFDATHGFNDALSNQWMTTEVLTTTLAKYADETTEIGKKAFAAAQDVKTFSQLMDTLKESAQSGWAETWQLFVGDFEEAKKTLSEFNKFFGDMIGKSAEARNTLFAGALTSSWGQLTKQVGETGLSVDEFQAALKDVGRESRADFDQMIEDCGGFEESLSQGWLTTEMVTKALDKMAESADGTVKYTDEQIELLRTLYTEANTSSGAVANLVQNMTRQSGRELIFDSLLNTCKAVQKVFQTLKGAWNAVFPPATSEQLYGIIEALHKFSERLIISDETADKISRTFKGLFSVLDIIKQAFSALFNVIKPLFGGLNSLSGGLLDSAASFGDWLVALDEGIKKGDVFNKALSKITGFVSTAIAKIKELIAAIKEKFDFPGFELFQNLLERAKVRISEFLGFVKSLGKGTSEAVNSFGTALSNNKIFDVFNNLFKGIQKIGTGIIAAVKALVGGIVNALSGSDFNGAIDALNGISFGAIAVGISKFISGLTKPLDEAGGFLKGLTGILDGVKGCFEAWQQDIKAGTLLKIAGAIAILAASLIALSLIDSNKLNNSLGALTVTFIELIGSMSLFSKIDGDSKSMNKTATAMIKLSAAVLVLSLALKSIASLDGGQLAKGLIGIAGLMAGLVASFKILGSGSGTVVKGSTQMLIFAAAIKVLASVCKDLAELSWEQMAKGLVGVGVLLAEVDVFLKTAKFSGKGLSTATGIVVLSAAIKVLASACKDFAKMSWSGIAKGLASVGALLAEVAAFTKLTGNAKHVISTGLALIEIGAAMKIFASAVSDFGNMSWEQIAKGLVAMAGALAEITIAVNLMPKKMTSIGVGLIAVGAALEIVANSLGKMGSMSWESIAKGLVTLGGAMAELAIGLNLMNGTLGGSAAMLVAAGALAVLTPILLILGSMSWESIAKGLVTLAGAFTVIGVAGALLSPIVPAILGLSGAFALIGVSALGIGAGLVLVGAGLSATAIGIGALATALGGGVTVIVAGLTAIITGIADLVPMLASKVGEAVVAFCQAISASAPALAEAVTTLVLMLVDVLVQCVPAIADGALALVAGVLEALVSYTPQIVDSIFQFLVGLIEGIARNIPDLIQAAVDLLMSFFAGIVSALSGIDTSTLLEGIVGIGLLSAIMAALSAVAALTPGAMVGVLGMGAVIAELALVLAAIGALAQIPGLSWLIGEGGQLLQGIGTAIGSFIGGIVGGFMSGVSSEFPQIGADLSAFMTNVQPFITGASSITPETFSGVKSLVEVVMLLTAADLLQGITSWLTGGSSLTDFANELVPFGTAMSKFSQSIAGMDANLVSQAAIAGKTLAEMADTIPNSGGVVGFFAGENDIDTFGKQLVKFGSSMAKFSDAVKGLDGDAVVSAANAGKAMAEMASTLPNSGGVVGFFAGENDMSTFGAQLVPFGQAIKSYSLAVKGLDVEAVNNSAIAGKAMAELASTLPNTGGAVSFFTGDNDLATFGTQLLSFGLSIKAYSLAVSGMDTDAINNSATAGKALVELANTVPKSGGLVSFFTGDNDLDDFGKKIVVFGGSMKAYAETIAGIDTEAVTASAIAAQSLAELQASLPNVGGVVSFFTGGNDLETFAEGLKPFGKGMKAYADSVAGMDTEAVTASTIAAQALSELQASLPNVGGVVEFFTGGNDLETFGAGLKPFGKGMKAYADSVAGMDTEAVIASTIAAQSLSELQASLPNVGGVVDFFTGGNDLSTFGAGIVVFGNAMKSYAEAVTGMDADAVIASTTAAQSLSELQASLPKVGGVMEFFTGGNDLETFAEGLKPFGKGMKSYADSVSGINAEAVTASAVAAQSLAELQASLPNVGGVMEFFTGGNDLATFSAGLIPFGIGMKAYATAVTGINTEAVTASAIAAQSLSELQASLPNVGGVMEFFTGGNDLATFSAGLIPFGVAMKSYADAVSGINADSVAASAIAAKSLVELQSSLPNVGGVVSFFNGETDLSGFGKQLISFGENLAAYSEAIEDVKPDAVTASANAASALSNLASGLPDSSLFDKWFGEDNSLASFGADVAEFGDYIGYYYSKVANADPAKLSGVITQVWALVDLAKGVKGIDKKSFSNFGSALKDLANTGVANFTAQFENSDQAVTSAVQGMLTDIKNSVTSNLSLLTPAAVSIVTVIGDEIKSNSATTVIRNMSSVMTNLCTTIRNFSANVKSATSSVITTAAGGISECKSSFEQAGRDVGQGFVNGINAMKSKASEAGKNLGTAALNSARKALDSHSPSRQFVAIGEDVGAGFEIGLKNSIPPAKKSTKNLVEEVVDAGTDAVKDSSSATDDWIAKLTETKETEVDNSEETAKVAKESAAEKVAATETVAKAEKSAFEEFEDRIEEERYYNRITTQEQLEQYEAIRNSSQLTADEIKKADREIYSLRKQLSSESYQFSMDWIDEEKYYNRLTLADELAAYKRVQSRYEKGTDERKKMDREVYRIEQEMYEAQEQYIADVQSAQEEANQKRLSLEQEYADKVAEINERLERDIQSVNDEYENKLESRANSLYQSYGLFDEVKEREAVSGETLMKNLEGQVKEFGAWQDILSSLSARGLSSELIEELQEMGPSAISQLEALNSMSDSELQKYADLWSIKHAQAREQAVTELEGLRIETLDEIAQLRSEAEQELDDYRSIWQQNMAQVTTDTNAKLEQLRRDFEEKVGLIKKNTDEEMEEMAETAQKILTEAGWDETGQAIVTGLTEGVQSQRSSFVDELTSMALEAVEAVKDTLEINSPSRVFKELGSYTGMGFVQGLTTYSEKSYTAGADMAESAKSGLATTIQSIASIIESGIDTEPTIRPVLDLTDISRGASEIDSVFGGVRTLGLAGQASIAFAAKEGSAPISVQVESREMIDELRSLRGEMSSMLDRMERIRVYLDTDTLVGELQAPMDTALGRAQVYRRRGN